MDELLRADITKVEPAVRDVMLSGRINALMPMSCMKDEEGITGVYSTDNMIPVKEGRFSAKSVLELMGRILRMTEELKDYLLFPEDMVFSADVIYIDPYQRATRICVIPDSDEINEKERVSYLLNELKSLTDERGEAYLDAFDKIYRERSRSVNALLSVLEDMKKEAGMV